MGEIADRIAEDAPGAAEAWLDGIFRAVERLARFPESGRSVPEIPRSEIREVIHDRYRILYRLDSWGVSVLTVRHSRQRTGPDDLAG
jgi:plasmid stabilization system protein ParE